MEHLQPPAQLRDATVPAEMGPKPGDPPVPVEKRLRGTTEPRRTRALAGAVSAAQVACQVVLDRMRKDGRARLAGLQLACGEAQDVASGLPGWLHALFSGLQMMGGLVGFVSGSV